MRVVFMGTPEFAVPALESIAREHRVTAAYTQPDRPRGRGRKLEPSPVKLAAAPLGIPVHQPESLRDSVVLDEIREHAPDAIVVAAYGQILPPEVLAVPRFGALNIHASLLPAYRGAAPIHRAILDGRREAGVVIMQMEEGLDTGPFTAARRIATDQLTVEQLEHRLALLGADAILDVLARLEGGNPVDWEAQKESLVSYAPKVTAEDVRLSPDLGVDDALRRIRASTSRARAKVRIEATVLDVLEARSSDVSLDPGQVSSFGPDLIIGLADGSLRLDTVRPEGRAAMDGCSYCCGARLSEGCSWESA